MLVPHTDKAGLQVRHTVFDDRLVVQWALPYAQCATSPASLAPTPASELSVPRKNNP